MFLTCENAKNHGNALRKGSGTDPFGLVGGAELPGLVDVLVHLLDQGVD
jgi:hypothetical protein